jgi:DNA-binding transcriptional MerR regulator
MKADKKQLSIQELAEIVGVSTSALRAWERRYSIFSPERTQGGHRLYTQDDLKLFWFVMHLRGQGRALKDISNLGREELHRQACSFFELKAPPEAKQKQTAQSIELPAPFEAILNALKKDDVESAILALERVYALSTSALSFADSALDLMSQIGEHWHKGEITVAAEHALTARLKHMLLGLFFLNSSTSDESSQPLAVCATLPFELHELGLLRVALYLKTWAYRVTYLGANTPIADLEDYCIRRNPTLVVVSCASSLSSYNILQSCQQLGHRVAQHTTVIVGGSGVKAIPKEHPDLSKILVIDHLEHLREIAQRASTYQSLKPTERLAALKAELHL